MKKLNKQLSFIIMLVFLLSCSQRKSISRRLIYANSEIEIEIKLNSLEYKNYDGSIHTFIKGKIKLKNLSTKTLILNLKNIQLILNDKSGHIYIDSIASHLITDREILKNSEINENVYWAFDIEFDEEVIDKMKIIYKSMG